MKDSHRIKVIDESVQIALRPRRFIAKFIIRRSKKAYPTGGVPVEQDCMICIHFGKAVKS